MERARRNGEISFWHRQIGIAPPRPPLRGDTEADVCIAGAGFTGLWTAYYLRRARPEWRIVVCEREFAGFGASGRNGGWVSDRFSGAGTPVLRDAMRATVDEVLAVCETEGIDADLIKPGVLRVARSPAQEARLRAGTPAPDDLWLDAAALEDRVHVSGARAAVYNPHCARAQPAKLVAGLAKAVERLGVTIAEDTTVTALTPGVAHTDRGEVRARHVLSCLEGFTPSLQGRKRAVLPLNSAMVVTDPLGSDRWAQIGWEGAELLGDAAHAYMYAQRTADGRIALGGRGVPYRYGSRTDRWGATQSATIGQLVDVLHAMFPQTADVAIDQAWCGVLGVCRDWTPEVRFDAAGGIGSAGGYVGSGVSATNLAARILADLVLGEETELTALPWVRPAPRRWEPEPLRWIGAQLVYGLYRAADRRESAASGPATHPLARAADLLSARPR